MAVTYPIIFTPTHNEEAFYTETVSDEVVRKLAQNANFISRLAPIGTIRAFALNQTGVSAPNPTLWQLCDGSEITNPTSPLRTIGLINQFTPNMLGRFVKGALTTSANTTGGVDSIGLGHEHGGQTGNFAPGFVGQGDIQVPSMHNHTHSISRDLTAQGVLDPANQQVAFYIKINN